MFIQRCHTIVVYRHDIFFFDKWKVVFVSEIKMKYQLTTYNLGGISEEAR